MSSAVCIAQRLSSNRHPQPPTPRNGLPSDGHPPSLCGPRSWRWTRWSEQTSRPGQRVTIYFFMFLVYFIFMFVCLFVCQKHVAFCPPWTQNLRMDTVPGPFYNFLSTRLRIKDQGPKRPKALLGDPALTILGTWRLVASLLHHLFRRKIVWGSYSWIKLPCRSLWQPLQSSSA